jgi:hypothetical protein
MFLVNSLNILDMCDKDKYEITDDDLLYSEKYEDRNEHK